MADSILGHETYKKNLEYLSYLIIKKQRLLDPYSKELRIKLEEAPIGQSWDKFEH